MACSLAVMSSASFSRVSPGKLVAYTSQTVSVTEKGEDPLHSFVFIKKTKMFPKIYPMLTLQFIVRPVIAGFHIITLSRIYPIICSSYENHAEETLASVFQVKEGLREGGRATGPTSSYQRAPGLASQQRVNLP